MVRLTSAQLKNIRDEKYRIQDERKTNSTLSKICNECGRYKRIPIHFCNDCWKEMDKTI